MRGVISGIIGLETNISVVCFIIYVLFCDEVGVVFIVLKVKLDLYAQFYHNG